MVLPANCTHISHKIIWWMEASSMRLRSREYHILCIFKKSILCALLLAHSSETFVEWMNEWMNLPFQTAILYNLLSNWRQTFDGREDTGWVQKIRSFLRGQGRRSNQIGFTEMSSYQNAGGGWVGLDSTEMMRVGVEKEISGFLPEPRTENSCPIWCLQQGIWASCAQQAGKRQLFLAGGGWDI